MNIDEFKNTLKGDVPPVDLSLALQALWWEARGDWDKAHELAQTREDAEGNWVHAYLHRREGDVGNAGYWYRRAGRPIENGALEMEWAAIVRALLG
jgi:hypothetical protein